MKLVHLGKADQCVASDLMADLLVPKCYIKILKSRVYY